MTILVYMLHQPCVLPRMGDTDGSGDVGANHVATRQPDPCVAFPTMPPHHPPEAIRISSHTTLHTNLRVSPYSDISL